MKGLLMKDFRLMKGQKNFFLVILVLAVFMTATAESTFAIAFLGFVGSLFTISSISYDEFDNGNAFLFSLPITRKGYVLEKYTFGFILGGCAWLFGVIISTCFSLAKGIDSYTDYFLSALLILPIILVLLSIMIPFQLKFGAEKGRIAIIAVVGGIAALSAIAANVLKTFGLDWGFVLNRLPAISMGMTILTGVLLAVVVLLLSYRISCKVMSKKEF